jgi:hypothetical protein
MHAAIKAIVREICDDPLFPRRSSLDNLYLSAAHVATVLEAEPDIADDVETQEVRVARWLACLRDEPVAENQVFQKLWENAKKHIYPLIVAEMEAREEDVRWNPEPVIRGWGVNQ